MGLDFGGVGSSKSKSTNENTSAGFSDIHDGAQVVNIQGLKSTGKNAVTNISLTDNGAVKSAFDFANKNSSQAYDFSRDVNRTAAQTVADAVSAVSASARSETENIFINLQKYALYGFMIWGVVKVFGGSK